MPTFFKLQFASKSLANYACQLDHRFPDVGNGSWIPGPINTKTPDKNRQGVQNLWITRRERQRKIQPTICLTEYRCYIKEGVPYATAGAVTPSWKIPSSIGQLPVPSALNARSPTLFAVIIQQKEEKVNTLFSTARKNALQKYNVRSRMSSRGPFGPWRSPAKMFVMLCRRFDCTRRLPRRSFAPPRNDTLFLL